MGAFLAPCCYQKSATTLVVEISGRADPPTSPREREEPGNTHKKVWISHEEDQDGHLIPITGDGEGQGDFTDFESESEVASNGAEKSEKSLKRNMTFQIMNSVEEDLEVSVDSETMTSPLMLVKITADLEALKASNLEAYTEAVEKRKDEALRQVAELVDKAYDILLAETMLTEVEHWISRERFMAEVVPTDLFERFARKLDYFYDVGISCCQNQDDWMEVYTADNGRQSLHGYIDQSDSSVLHYAARMEIPTSMTNVLAVANEIELMQKWNSLVVKEPETIGRRTGHYMVLNYQVSALGGMYKVDVLNEIRRFSDVDGGFLVEYVSSVKKDHPSYREPSKGYKRMQTMLKNVILACGPNCTVLIQIGKLKLPISATKWLAKTLGGIAGKFIIGGLVANSKKAAEPGSPWEKLAREDRFGFYARLNECMASEASKSRDPVHSKDGKATNIDVQKIFDGRRFQRASARITNGRTPSCQY